MNWIKRTHTSWTSKIARQKKFHEINDTLSTLFYSLEKSTYPTDKFLGGLETAVKQLTIEPLQHLQKTEPEFQIPSLSEPISIEQRDMIQFATLGQSSSILWKSLRNGRITASQAGMCFKSRTSVKDRLSRIIVPTEAMNHGKAFEQLALDCLSTRANVNIVPCGFWIDLQRPWLGASPDGLIYDTELRAVVEVKSPYITRFNSIENYKKSKSSCLDTTGLKRNHDYFYQIQMQMGVTGAKEGLFCVYTGADVYYEWIPFDPVLWNEMLVKFDALATELYQQSDSDY